MDLNTIWFALCGVLLTGYAVLDGFDLGVGVLHLFARTETERRISINAIAPVWDGNEVWLLTGGGALFAAFPPVYATVFSGFYLALVLLLVALIFRAVAMEFRGKVDAPSWRRFWDRAFGVSSFLPAVLLGVAFGNILRGIPIDSRGAYAGTFFDLLNPFSVLVGLTTLVMFTMHGATFLALKTEGEFQRRVVHAAERAWIWFVVLYCCATAWALLSSPYLFQGLLSNPLFWILFLAMLGGGLYHPVAMKGGRHVAGFCASSAVIAGAVGLSAVSLYPRLVPSLPDLSSSLTITNASSSHETLSVMLVIALAGMPLVVCYTWYIYRVFKGKVVLGPDSY